MRTFELLDRQSLAREIFRLSHLTGQFTLRSGKTSHEYFDKYQFESHPQILSSIAHHMFSLLPPGTELLAGLEMGGIPVATALSFETGLPVVFVRKTAKVYGTCRLAEGPEIRGRKVCVVEDVITTGGQVVTSVLELRKLGAEINTVVCVIDRSEGKSSLADANLSLNSLFLKSTLYPLGL